MSAPIDVPLLGTATVAAAESFELAEGLFWDPERERLMWVDILRGTVHVGRLAEGGAIHDDETILFPDTAGAVCVSRTGEMLVAGTHRLYTRGLDGGISAAPPAIEGAERRFNDGKPDPAGRFVVGTKGPGGERLLRVESDGAITVLDDDLTLSNGLAWTRDGRTMYSVDTFARRIHARPYDPETGAVGSRRVFVELASGYPDGLTIDDDDHLWVAVWGEGCVLRISPDGAIVGRVDVAAPQTTCPVFAGPDLDVLVVASATEGMSPADLAAHPLSGRLFTVRTGHRGVRPHLWAPPPSPVPTSKETP